MKKKVFLFIVLCVSISSFAQQRNYAQEFVDLFLQGRFFEAREFKSQYANQLSDNKVLDLLYNMHLSVAFNKPESAIVYFEEFLGNPDYLPILNNTIASYYGRLNLIYEEKQQYEQAISTLERLIDYLEKNPHSLDQEMVKNEIHGLQTRIASLKEKAKNYPVREMKRDSDTCKIKLKDDACIRFDALYNGQKIETLFDTSIAHYLYINENLAKDIGVKIMPDQDTIQLINGNPVRVLEGIIDSVNLKGVKLYNIPVEVFDEKFSSTIPFLKKRQVIMGLPTMKMIGRFEFDWKSNELCIPPRQESMGINPTSNLMFFQDAPYLNLKINDTEFTGFFNTGSDHFLYLTYPYFRRNRKYIEIESEAPQSFSRTTLSGTRDLEREKVKSSQIYFDGKMINDSNFEVYVTDVVWINRNVFDGEVGTEFIRKFGSKCILDFDAMTVECDD